MPSEVRRIADPSYGAYRFRTALLACVAASLWAAGCADPEAIRTYRVPKDVAASETGGAARPEPLTGPGRLLAALVPHGRSVWAFTIKAPRDKLTNDVFETFVTRFVPSIRFEDGTPAWELPQGWERAAASSDRSPFTARFATVRVPVDEGDPLELTVMQMPAGDDPAQMVLMNVQRWQRLLRLPEFSAAELQAAARDESRTEIVQREIDGRQVTLVDLRGEWQEQGMRRPPFVVGDSSPDRPTSRQLRTPHGRAAAASATSNLPALEVPPRWKRRDGGGAGGAVFEIADGGEQAEVTVNPFPAQAAAPVQVANIWRTLLGLRPVAAEEIEKQLQRLSTADGRTAHYVEITGPERTDGGARQMILGAIVPSDGGAWLIKLRGPQRLAQSERERFQKFIRTLRLRPQEGDGNGS